MPRPPKKRRVCCMPLYAQFGPTQKAEEPPKTLVMTVDEFETIRLIDQEGFTQEQCAKEMGVARTTVQGIYERARKKIAQAIILGYTLLIEGGHYHLDSNAKHCSCKRHFTKPSKGCNHAR